MFNSQAVAASSAGEVTLADGKRLKADLVIGARTELAMDPHAQWLDTNTSYYNHIYGSLVRIDEKSAIVADLAESWKVVSDTEWQFALRKGVNTKAA